jgi:hypothetical protein
MTAEQTDLFDSNRELANRAAGKYPIAGEDEEFVESRWGQAYNLNVEHCDGF